MAAGAEPVDVFLGGACSPTTWRIDAMRELSAAGCTFYSALPSPARPGADAAAAGAALLRARPRA